MIPTDRNFISFLLKGLWLDIKLLSPDIDWTYGLVTTHLLINEKGYFALTVELPRLDECLLAWTKGEDSSALLECPHLQAIWSMFLPLLERGTPTLSTRHTVECLRQLACIGKKLEVNPPAGSDELMKQRFLQTDRELPDEIEITVIERLAGDLLREVLPSFASLDFHGRHGAGSVADRIGPSLRYDTKLQTTEELARLTGLYSDYVLPYFPLREQIEPVTSYSPSRVTTVPKDGRGPRIICMEPCGLMFHELAIMDNLYAHFNTHPLTRGRVNVQDQQINRDLALEGSLVGTQATIDLSEASDRVSLALVRNLFPPEWFALLCAGRSPTFELDGEVFPFKKFAPMGSALCFPVETLVFWALAAATISRKTGISLMRASQKVVVHGDDTIVPNELASDVMVTFERNFLKVNHGKSFHTGFFRESCGGDYFYGHDVTPIRWKHAITEDIKESILSTFALSNTFYKKGWWSSAHSIREWLSINHKGCSHFWYKLNEDSQPAGLGFASFLAGGAIARWSPKVQKPVIRSLVATSIKDGNQPSDKARLREYFADRAKFHDTLYEPSIKTKRGKKLRKTNVPVQTCLAGLIALKAQDEQFRSIPR